MHTVEPKVYLIGKSEFSNEGIYEWLHSLGATDFTPKREFGPGAGLIEMAGRTCYLSFQPFMNKNVKKIREDLEKYLDNILSSGHGCYDSETEVLTYEGWKKWPDVTMEDRFCTMNHDRKIVYLKPVRLVQYPYKGKMYRVEGQGVDLLVTPNHNMYVSSINDRQFYQLVKAEDLGDKSHAYMKDGVWDINDSPISQDWLSLLGFAIGDGHLSSKGTGNYLDFKLKSQEKKEWLRHILAILDWRYTEKDEGREGIRRFYVYIPDEYRSFFSHMYSSSREKQIPQPLLTSRSRSSLSKLFEGLMMSDGYISKDKGSYYKTTSKTLADQMQILALHIGSGSNISIDPPRLTGFYSDKPVYRVGIIQERLRPAVNKVKDDLTRGRSSWVENWEGEVFCVEMPDELSNHTLFVRRNGKSVWSSNSVLEHVTYNFALENVSRVFSAEMNRHRAGVSISERSLRYVRFNDIAYWIPESIKDQEEDVVDTINKKTMTRSIFNQVFRFVEQKYKQLEEIWDIDNLPDFHSKKQLTSMFRRIIPMGVATGGVWSGNIRALRHIFEMRCSPAAEEEIAIVCAKMLQIMIKEEPLLFKDFYFDEEEKHWKCKYSKV
jgi:flavin-dependent thymidylate synthase